MKTFREIVVFAAWSVILASWFVPGLREWADVGLGVVLLDLLDELCGRAK